MSRASLHVVLLAGCFLCLVSCNKLNPLAPAAGIQNSSSSTPNASGLVLWNKLGSAAEVGTSSYGPNGTITGSMVYSAAKFGSGACPATGGQASSINFPSSIFTPDRGTVELWYNKLLAPYYNAPGHEFHGFVNSRFGNDGNTVLFSYDSYSGAGFVFNVCFGNGTMADTTAPVSLGAGLYHVALVWDRTGIAGTSQTIRIYLDGAVIYSNSLTGWGTTSSGTFKVGMNAGTYGGSNPAYAVDNLKIYNYAKTDFSDRFSE